jgi:hypothetical protein
VILFRLTKKTAISANLFTPEHKILLNCVLRGTLVWRTKKQLNSDLSVFQYYKLLRLCGFVSFNEKNCYICKFIYARTQTHVKLCFTWYISESDFEGPKRN